MMYEKSFLLSDIVKVSGGSLLKPSDAEKKITHLGSLIKSNSNTLVMFHHKKYLHQLETSSAGACILHQDFVNHAPKGMTLIVHPNPYKGFALVTKLFSDTPSAQSYQAPTAYVGSQAKIGENCIIEHGAYISDGAVIGDNCKIGVNSYIGKNVVIGHNCQIENQVSIDNTRMGNDVIVYPGARIGQEGFGFASDKHGHYKIYHQGLVTIGNDVEIGANTCIDRGTLENTEIGDHVRLDNLIQIGHNVKIGKGTIIAAQCGIAGSSFIGERVLMGGQVGVNGHIRIENDAVILGKSMIVQNVSEKARVGGAPAVPFRQFHRQTVLLKKLVYKEKNNSNLTLEEC